MTSARTHRHRRRLLAPLALVGIVAAMAGCGSDEPDVPAASSGAGASTTAAAVTLETTTWELDPASLGLPGTDRIQPTLTMSDGHASGFTGCNRFTSGYTTSGSSLTFTQIAMTAMACPPDETAIEREFVDRLGKVTTYEIDAATLTLHDSAGATTLTFAAANSSLVGDWSVVGYLTSSGTAFTSVVAGSQLTVNFAADGSVSGNTGCNTFRGAWTQGPADAVKIDQLASTLAACTDPDLSAQEQSFMQALPSSTTAEVASHEASFFNSAGLRTLMLTR